MGSSRWIYAVALAAVLSGGAKAEPIAMSPQQWTVERKKLSESAAARKDQIEKCALNLRLDRKALATRAILMNVPEEKAPELFCTRIVGAIVSGTYNYEMFLRMSKGEAIPAMIKIIQGR